VERHPQGAGAYRGRPQRRGMRRPSRELHLALPRTTAGKLISSSRRMTPDQPKRRCCYLPVRPGTDLCADGRMLPHHLATDWGNRQSSTEHTSGSTEVAASDGDLRSRSVAETDRRAARGHRAGGSTVLAKADARCHARARPSSFTPRAWRTARRSSIVAWRRDIWATRESGCAIDHRPGMGRVARTRAEVR